MIAAQRTDFVYRPSQPWVPTNMKLAFILENGDGLGNVVEMVHDESIACADDKICVNDQVSRFESSEDDGQPRQSTDAVTESVQSELLQTPTELLVRELYGSPAVYDQHEQNTPDTKASLSYVLSSPSTLLKESSLASSFTTVTDNQTPDARSQASLCTDISSVSVPPLTHREALLMQYFIRVISPWVRKKCIKTEEISTDGAISLTSCKMYPDLPKRCH